MPMLVSNMGVLGRAYEDNLMETDEPKPTAASLEAIWNTIKADYNNDIIDMNRRIEYPTVEELVVALRKPQK